jgi:hypothetical protein
LTRGRQRVELKRSTANREPLIANVRISLPTVLD